MATFDDLYGAGGSRRHPGSSRDRLAGVKSVGLRNYATPYARTPQHLSSINSFNSKYGSNSANAQQSRQNYADASGMSSVVAAARRQREANRANPRLGDAPVNSIVGASGRTLSYDSRTGVATRGGTDPTYTGATYVAPGTSEPRSASSGGFAGPLGSPRAAGAENIPAVQQPVLRNNTVTAAASEDLQSPVTAGDANQPAQEIYNYQARNQNQSNVGSEDIIPSRENDTIVEIPENGAQGGITRQQRALIANQIASRTKNLSPEDRIRVLQDMNDNNPTLGELFKYDEFNRLMQLYWMRGQ